MTVFLVILVFPPVALLTAAGSVLFAYEEGSRNLLLMVLLLMNAWFFLGIDLYREYVTPVESEPGR